MIMVLAVGKLVDGKVVFTKILGGKNDRNRKT